MYAIIEYDATLTHVYINMPALLLLWLLKIIILA